MASNYEDNFWKTIWEFLPGILKFFSIIAIVGLIFNIFTLFITQSSVVVDSGNFDVPIQRSYNYVYGKADSKVKLVYFLDYQCPACRANQSIMSQIKPQYADRVGFVYKNFPLESIHIYAKTLAKAAQAAGIQGKYFDFGDKVFDLQDGSKYSASSIESVARDVGLDVDKWNTDRNSDEVNKQVENDQKDLENVDIPANPSGNKKPGGGLVGSDGQSLGTPTSVLYKDGVAIDWWSGGLPIADLQSKLDNALK